MLRLDKNKMQKINYDLIMQKRAEEHRGKSLLLHACCAPCSSSVLKRLADYFALTIFYYNPNIDSREEYEKRWEELERLTSIYNGRKISPWQIKLIFTPYNPLEFEKAVKGFENCKEGGQRCHLCYALRLKKTYEIAKEARFNFFCSTLSVSPYKNVRVLNEIGSSLTQEKDGTSYLPNDFKKRDGYLESIRMSRQLQLYRQDYCGCVYSKDL